MKKQTVKVKKDDDNPIPIEVLEESIVSISQAVRKLNRTRLTQRALIVLLADTTRVSRGHIEAVLRGIADLESLFLKPEKK